MKKFAKTNKNCFQIYILEITVKIRVSTDFGIKKRSSTKKKTSKIFILINRFFDKSIDNEVNKENQEHNTFEQQDFNRQTLEKYSSMSSLYKKKKSERSSFRNFQECKKLQNSGRGVIEGSSERATFIQDNNKCDLNNNSVKKKFSLTKDMLANLTRDLSKKSTKNTNQKVHNNFIDNLKD